MNPKKFDGIANFTSDDEIERKLESHFNKHALSSLEILKNFQIYARRISLKKFLAHYELFQKTINLPGDIVELGVFQGRSLMSWGNFLEIHNMGDRQKQVFGFDTFQGFVGLSEKDGQKNETNQKFEGGFNAHDDEVVLKEAIEIFDEDRFIPYKPRIKLIKGDISATLPKFLNDNQGLRISLLHFDCDLYEPTLKGLELLWPLVVPGGVVLFDEYAIRPWAGESNAVDDYFKKTETNIKIQKFSWSPNPGGYVVKV